MARDPELEVAVMRALWADGGSLTPKEVQHLLTDRGLAYTTIMTVMVRLWEKGQLIRQKSGRSYRYSPAHPSSEVVASNMAALLAEMHEPESVLTHFTSALSDDDVVLLKQILKER